ncbi:hypothetical protein [Streptomyces sp. NPDC002463]|uniref:hypothetical protein n=1 Tax=Streptomyces sp. NPDC002463 TaxID=3364645 RepID=UPI0036927AE2
MIPEGGTELEILVEPFGRVGYGPHLADRKGLVAGVRLDHQHLFGWDIRVLPLEDLTGLTGAAAAGSATETVTGPAFHRAVVGLPAAADAFIAVLGSDRTLGLAQRFPHRSPEDREGLQHTLYAPAPLWGPGRQRDPAPRPHGTTEPLSVELWSEPALRPIAPAPRY